MTTTNTGGQTPPTPLDSYDAATLAALARRRRVPFHLADGPRLVVRPIRTATPDQVRVRAALLARADAVRDYLLASRPHLHGPMAAADVLAAGGNIEADAAAWRVCHLPYDALVALVINGLNE